MGLRHSSRCTFINQFLELAFNNVLAHHLLAGKKNVQRPNLVADPCPIPFELLFPIILASNTRYQLTNALKCKRHLSEIRLQYPSLTSHTDYGARYILVVGPHMVGPHMVGPQMVGSLLVTLILCTHTQAVQRDD